jgi:hypothetical protein
MHDRDDRFRTLRYRLYVGHDANGDFHQQF